MHRIRALLAAAVIAVGGVTAGVLALAGDTVLAPQAGASYPVGTIITVGNQPAPGGSVSCWQQVVNTTAHVVNCYKYNVAGGVTGTSQFTLPSAWCNEVRWVVAGSGSSMPRLEIANQFWAEAALGFYHSGWNGGAGGCGVGINQSGSQAWANNYVTPDDPPPPGSPVACTAAAPGGCTVNLGTLAGGSWVTSMTASRSQDANSPWGHVYPHGESIRTLIWMG